MAGDGVRIEIYARLVNSGYWWWLNVTPRAIRRNWTTWCAGDNSSPPVPRFFGKRVPSIREKIRFDYFPLLSLSLSLSLQSERGLIF